ncbi:MAG: ABA4-like family protein [Pseudomonadota bacterium]
MDWATLFGAINLAAMIAWIGLVFLPRWPALLSAILYVGVGLLCLVYAVCLIGILTGLIPAGEGGGGADFTTIEGVRSIFESDGGVTVGWAHYLAFDLFVGLWIAARCGCEGDQPLYSGTHPVCNIDGGAAWPVHMADRARTCRAPSRPLDLTEFLRQISR